MRNKVDFEGLAEIGQHYVDVKGYVDLELIGAGGNAHVYSATSNDTGREVAVKILRGAGDEAVNRRFERERSMMAELEQLANVVPVFESGFTPSGDPFLIMPFYNGGSLQQLLEDGPVRWRDAVVLVRKVANAIAAAHAKRILHLDVKPANVLLDSYGEPWVVDFGISEMVGSTASMSARMLTPTYAPPERLNGAKPSEHTDIYGLAATLFALIAGKAPYVSSDRTNPMAVMMAVTNEPVPVAEISDRVPENLSNLIERSLAKKISDRPASANEFVSLLDDVLLGRAVPLPNAVETSLFAAGPQPAGMARPLAMAPPLPAPLQSDEDKSRRETRAMVVAALVLLGSIGLISLLALITGDDGDDALATGGDSAVVTGRTGNDAEAESTGDETGDETVGDADGDGDLSDADPEVEVLGRNVLSSDDEDNDDPSDEGEDDGLISASEQITDAELSSTARSVDGDDSNADASDSEATSTRPDAETTTSTSAAPTTSAPATTASSSTTTSTSTTRAPTTTAAPSTTAAPTTTSAPTTTVAPSTTSAPTTTAARIALEADWMAVGGSAGSEQTLTFTNITVGEVSLVNWDFGDGRTASGESTTHAFSAPGVYTVTMTATGPSGTDTSTRAVQVRENTAAFEAGWRAVGGSVGEEQTMTFNSITVGEASSFTWDFGDGSTGTGENVRHTYAAPGRYAVTLTAVGPNGESDTATHDVVVRAQENRIAAPIASFRSSIVGPGEQQSVEFTNNSRGEINTYLWNFGDGTTSSEPIVIHDFSAPGRYTVRLTVTGPGGSSTDTEVLVIAMNS